MTLEVVLDQMESGHRDRYAQDSNQLAPFIMLFGDDHVLTSYVGIPMDDDRDRTVLAILAAVVSTQSHGYVFSSEAWMAFVKKDDWESGDQPMPRDDPERQEVLIMEANSFKGTAMRIFDIKRDAEGNFLDFVRRDMDSLRMHSRFDIFPRPKHAV